MSNEVAFAGKLGDKIVDALDAACAEREAGSGARQGASRRGADAARRARDDRGSAFELRHAPELIFELGLVHEAPRRYATEVQALAHSEHPAQKLPKLPRPHCPLGLHRIARYRPVSPSERS